MSRWLKPSKRRMPRDTSTHWAKRYQSMSKAKALIDTLALKLIETDFKTLGHPAGYVLAKARVDKLADTLGDAEAQLKTIGKCGG